LVIVSRSWGLGSWLKVIELVLHVAIKNYRVAILNSCVYVWIRIVCKIILRCIKHFYSSALSGPEYNKVPNPAVTAAVVVAANVGKVLPPIPVNKLLKKFPVFLL
jgi:hypothetical protein